MKKLWTIPRSLHRIAEYMLRVREQILRSDHAARSSTDLAGVTYAMERPAGGYSGWWSLKLTGERPSNPRDWVMVCVRRNAQQLSLRLGRAPTLDGASIVRIPDDITDVFLRHASDAAEQDGLSLRLSLRRLSKGQAALAILGANPSQFRSFHRTLTSRGAKTAIEDLFRSALPIRTDNYRSWIAAYDRLADDEPKQIRDHIGTLRNRPVFSIIVPVYETPAGALRAMIESVKTQIYPDWELCIADDCSKSPYIREVLEDAAAGEPRIKLVFRPDNGNISACSNSALELATGSYLALLDHDDVLAPHALAMMADAINAHPDADIFYSDEDKLDDEGRRYDPYFKPDFNRELLYGQNFVSHLGVFRASAVQSIGRFRLGFEGSQDYDLVLRLVAATDGPIVHVPHVLYHWRLYPGAGTFSSTQHDRASLAARRAINEQLASRGQIATVEAGIAGYHRVRRHIKNWPRISIVIPTRDHANLLADCLQGLLNKTDYPDLDIIVADNGSCEPATAALFASTAAFGVRVVACPGEFNYSKINNDAVRYATGDHILFLNNDISILEPTWLKEMVAHLAETDVGAVGAKLLYPDGTLQHAGVTLGVLGVAGHTQRGAAGNSFGYFGQLGLARDVSCATAACLLVRRDVFEQIGGFDQDNLKVAFNDVDLCIRIGRAGYRIVWTPYASLMHHESKTRGSDVSGAKFKRFEQERIYMRDRWGTILDNDPFWNPNLSLQANDPEPAFPPRVRRPWQTASSHQ